MAPGPSRRTPPLGSRARAPRGNRLRTVVGEIDVPDVACSGEIDPRALTPIPIFVDDDD